MNPIIIMGMDNTGKTTLQENLGKEFRNYFTKVAEMVKEDAPKSVKELSKGKAKLIKSPGPLGRQEMHQWCYTQMIRFNTPLTDLEIYDRFGCIDEQIYAPIVRNIHELDHVEHLTNIMKELPLEAKPLLVYARPSSKKIIGFEDGREQMEGVEENAKELLAAYDDLYFKFALDPDLTVILYSYETDIPQEIMSTYIDYMVDQKNKLMDINTDELVEFLSKEIPHVETEGRSLKFLRTLQLDYRAILTGFINMWRALELQGKELPKKDRELLLKNKLALAKKSKELDGMILNKL